MPNTKSSITCTLKKTSKPKTNINWEVNLAKTHPKAIIFVSQNLLIIMEEDFRLIKTGKLEEDFSTTTTMMIKMNKIKRKEKFLKMMMIKFRRKKKK